MVHQGIWVPLQVDLSSLLFFIGVLMAAAWITGRLKESEEAVVYTCFKKSCA